MITVKQYADERHITIQAVHQSMNGKRKKARLEGHVKTVDGVKYLDDEAVRILDEARSKSPIVWEKADTTERIEELEREREGMLLKIAAQADRISELAQWKADKALEIASAEQTRLLLTAAEQEKRLLEGFVADAKAEIAVLSDERAEAEGKAKEADERAQKAEGELTAVQDELTAVQAELDAEKKKNQELENRTFWQNLTASFRKKGIKNDYEKTGM